MVRISHFPALALAVGVWGARGGSLKEVQLEAELQNVKFVMYTEHCPDCESEMLLDMFCFEQCFTLIY